MKNQQEIVEGYATFYTNQNHLRKILSNAERRILLKNIWKWQECCHHNHQYSQYFYQYSLQVATYRYRETFYNSYLWKQIFSKMKKCSCKHLFLRVTQNSTIIKDIQHIHFTQLKWLELSDNSITNAENLQFLNLENLTDLNLDRNLISQLQFFHKLRMPNLQKLDLSANPIKQIEKISKCLMNSNILKRLYLQQKRFEQICTFQDLSLIIKYNCIKIQHLSVIQDTTSTTRIKQINVRKVLNEKYKSLTVIELLDQSW